MTVSNKQKRDRNNKIYISIHSASTLILKWKVIKFVEEQNRLPHISNKLSTKD